MNLLKRIISNGTEWYMQMERILRAKAQRKGKVEARGCHRVTALSSDQTSSNIRKVIASGCPGITALSSNQVCITLPGRRYRVVNVRDDESISSLREKMAARLGVKARNWGIYAVQDNKPLKLVDDTKKINQIDRKSLYFYPKIVIR